MSGPFTILDDGRESTIDARIDDGQVRMTAETVERALGWRLEANGLCRGAVCVPVSDPSRIAQAGAIDLAALAEALGRPLALDVEERAAALGVAADERAASLASLEAPDFRLPDLDGRMHTLSEHRGKKVLLIAYASW